MTRANAKVLLVTGLILVPLALIGYFTYFPVIAVDPGQVHRVAVIPTQFQGSSQYAAIAHDATTELESHLSGEPDLNVAVVEVPEKVHDTVILSGITLDSGIAQFNLQIIDAGERRVLWSQQFQSPMNRVPEMLRVASEAVRRELRP